MSGAAPTREVAYRVFADEFADSTYSYAESDDDRAPQYLVTPTGARVNRLFVVGVLTETEEVSDGVLRARIVDPTGAFVLYAGQYQPDALAFFERADPPIFVALTGKTRTFEPEGSDRVLTSLRPEQVNEVDAKTRDSWVIQTAQHTLERAAILGLALEYPIEDLGGLLSTADVESGLAAGIPHAIREYEPTTGYLGAVQDLALDAVRVVAGEKDEVTGIEMDPAEGGKGAVRTGFTDISLGSGGAENGAKTTESDLTEGDADSTTDAEPPLEAEAETDTKGGPDTESEAGTPSETEPDSETVKETASETEAAPKPETEKPDAPSEETPSETAESEVEPDEEDEMYELSEEERQEVKENFDVGFESGTEIGSPDATEDIEPEAEQEPGPDSPEREFERADHPEENGAAEESEPSEQSDTTTDAADTEAVSQSEGQAESFSEGELQNLVVDTLQELGDGDGVPRSELIETLQDRHDLEEAAIESAIEDALLGGRCFESGAEALKPI